MTPSRRRSRASATTRASSRWSCAAWTRISPSSSPAAGSCCATGCRQRSRTTRPGVVAKFGVAPASIPDYLALVGDASDGYPRPAGLGLEERGRGPRALGAPRRHPAVARSTGTCRSATRAGSRRRSCSSGMTRSSIVAWPPSTATRTSPPRRTSTALPGTACPRAAFVALCEELGFETIRAAGPSLGLIRGQIRPRRYLRTGSDASDALVASRARCRNRLTRSRGRSAPGRDSSRLSSARPACRSVAAAASCTTWTERDPAAAHDPRLPRGHRIGRHGGVPQLPEERPVARVDRQLDDGVAASGRTRGTRLRLVPGASLPRLRDGRRRVLRHLRHHARPGVRPGPPDLRTDGRRRRRHLVDARPRRRARRSRRTTTPGTLARPAAPTRTAGSSTSGDRRRAGRRGAAPPRYSHLLRRRRGDGCATREPTLAQRLTGADAGPDPGANAGPLGHVDSPIPASNGHPGAVALR